MSSGLPLIVDIARYSWHVANVPIATEMGCPCHFRSRHDGGGTSHSRLATERVPITSRRLAHCGRSIAGGWGLAHRDCDRLRHHRRAHAGCASNRAPDASASRPGATRTARSFDPPSCQDIAKPCPACLVIRCVALPDVRSDTEELIDQRSMIRSARDSIHEI